MAFDVNGNGGYGSGTDGNLTATAGQVVNAYAKVTAITTTTITTSNVSDNAGSSFTAGKEILIHVSGYTGTADTCAARGAWAVAKINSVNGSTLTLDRDVSSILCGLNISQLYVQAVSLPNYKTVTLNSGKSITCPQFTAATGYGGIVALKCSTELKFNGGHINVGDKGLNDYTLFNKGLVDKEPYDSIPRESAGWENHRAQNHLTINYPDGAVFIIAKKFTCHDNSRIGRVADNLEGIARQTFKTIGTNYYHDHIGGSSILIAAESVADFNPAIISKYTIRTSATNARGLGRCYIATETVLPCDEGLYAYDRIATPERLSESFNIKNFGDGSFGDKTNYKVQLNSYVAVTALDSTRKIVTFNNKNEDGLAKFKTGALVMVHLTQKDNVQYAGRFILAKVLGATVNTITLDTAIPKTMLHNKYYMQLVAIPQFTTFTLSAENAATPKFENGRGGICAVAVNGTCNLSGGKLNVEGKGGAPAYGEKGLNYISNAQMADKLPLGEGNGSVFILANNLTMNASTRLGALWTGNYRGGLAYHPGSPSSTTYLHNYPNQRFEGGDLDAADNGMGRNVGKDTQDGSEQTEFEHGMKNMTYYARAGGGKMAGYGRNNAHKGGFGSNADDGAWQGAHVLIVANKITGLNVAALSTGGAAGNNFHSTDLKTTSTNKNGGCGYGGAGGSFNSGKVCYQGGNGGYLGGGGGIANTGGDYVSGGGSGAFAFIYANQLVDPDYSGITYD